MPMIRIRRGGTVAPALPALPAPPVAAALDVPHLLTKVLQNRTAVTGLPGAPNALTVESLTAKPGRRLVAAQ